MDTFIGTIALFGFNFQPRGWAFCNGQLMSISQNSALFSLLGTMYGGDGVTTFGLPDLRGRFPVGQGNGPGLSPYQVGQMGGTEQQTITTAQLPAHTHALIGSSSDATASTLNGNVLASSNGVDTVTEAVITVNAYAPAGNPVAANNAAIGMAGSSQPVSTMSPYIALNFCIATEGIYPSRQ